MILEEAFQLVAQESRSEKDKGAAVPNGNLVSACAVIARAMAGRLGEGRPDAAEVLDELADFLDASVPFDELERSEWRKYRVRHTTVEARGPLPKREVVLGDGWAAVIYAGEYAVRGEDGTVRPCVQSDFMKIYEPIQDGGDS